MKRFVPPLEPIPPGQAEQVQLFTSKESNKLDQKHFLMSEQERGATNTFGGHLTVRRGGSEAGEGARQRDVQGTAVSRCGEVLHRSNEPVGGRGVR